MAEIKRNHFEASGQQPSWMLEGSWIMDQKSARTVALKPDLHLGISERHTWVCLEA